MIKNIIILILVILYLTGCYIKPYPPVNYYTLQYNGSTDKELIGCLKGISLYQLTLYEQTKDISNINMSLRDATCIELNNQNRISQQKKDKSL